MIQQKITPFLWFDSQAGEAAKFYASVFPDSKIKHAQILENTPSGTVEILTVGVLGLDLRLMSAGPAFKISPALSFFVRCSTAAEVDLVWKKLAEGGFIMMELGSYPFSERYGWVQDKFGVSWQVGVFVDPAIRQQIVPSMMFVGGVCGKAEEAIKLYTSIFKDSAIGTMDRYGAGEKPDAPGTIKYGTFKLAGQWFTAMDSAYEHAFSFGEAMSFEVTCESQAEIDEYWHKLSADPKAEVCGWLKDKFGFSWQITPRVLDEMMRDTDKQKVARVTESFLKMKKMIIADLEKAFAGK